MQTHRDMIVEPIGLEADVLVVSGGVSEGAYDLVEAFGNHDGVSFIERAKLHIHRAGRGPGEQRRFGLRILGPWDDRGRQNRGRRSGRERHNHRGRGPGH